MRLIMKAGLVCMLGLVAVSKPGGADDTGAVANPCGTLYCVQGGCPADVDTWCASRVWGPCPGENVCSDPFICGGQPWAAEVICGEGET